MVWINISNIFVNLLQNNSGFNIIFKFEFKTEIYSLLMICVKVFNIFLS